MKTITIPKSFGYPTLDITINGKTYKVKSGEAIETEDAVAEVIENAIKLAPKQGRYLSKFAQFANGTITEITESDLEGAEAIAAYSFRNCYSLTSVEIPDSVMSIGESAIFGCGKLKSVRFGSNSKIETIAADSFTWCSQLARVYLPEKPPMLENTNAFDNISPACVFYCKTQESLDAYKAAANWSTLAETYTFALEPK